VDIDKFSKSPVGRLTPISGIDVRSGQVYNHYAYVPDPLPAEIPLQQKTYKILTDADRALGRLDAAAQRLPNPRLLVRPTIFREAVSTSAIEGTYAPLVEVLEADIADDHSGSQEVQEILNYVRASEQALNLIKEKPICVSVIAKLQKTLVEGTRGDSYDAGQLRQSQVMIGDPKQGVEQSRFVPPPPIELVEGITAWERWINAEDDIPLLVKAAVGHYQFETLHPFRDGNGRLGRLITVLQMLAVGALHYPILNIAPYIEPRKEEYKDHLLNCSLTGDFDPWVRFFAEAVKAEADDSVGRIEELIQVRQDMLDKLRADKAQGVVLDIVEDLIGYPLITPSRAADLHGVTYPPAAKAIARLEKLGIVYEVTGKSYGRMYLCPAVLRATDRPPMPT
jgi:Fic family protein